MKKLNPQGFSVVDALLILVIVGIIGAVGWYVWNKNQEKKELNAISSFAKCKVHKDSKIQESYPEVCVTKNGKKFTNQDQKVNPDNGEPIVGSPIKFSTIDSALQVLVRTAYEQPGSGCQTTNPNAMGYVDYDNVVQKYKAKTAAFVGIGCDGGAVHLFGYKNGKWVDAASTQMAFLCADLKTYNVPASFTSTCFEAEKEVSYP